MIVGDGPERERLQRQAPANVEFVGRVEEDALAGWYAGARCLVFPGEEDFGIVPLEAQSAGVPVVAYGRGGALESVVEGKTGVFFHLPTPEALAEAVQKLDKSGLTADDCRRHARTFDRSAFLAQMTAAVEAALAAGPHAGRSHAGAA